MLSVLDAEQQFPDVVMWAIVAQSVGAWRRVATWCTQQHKTWQDALQPIHFANLGLTATHLPRYKEWRANALTHNAFQHSVLNALNYISQHNIHIIRQTDAAYPAQLQNISDAPPFLFVQGNTTLWQRPCIAMVGTRKATPLGVKNTLQFAEHFAQAGYVVVSGLAAGIDAAAHQGALACGEATTLAVLGTGLDIVFPAHHKSLYQDILARSGTIISEFLPGTPAMAHHFPRRNRIVSGLSCATVVMEAASKSGSLITAQLAAEQGRLVFAVPGAINNLQAKGCHELIREGAILVDHPDQVLSDVSSQHVMPLPEKSVALSPPSSQQSTKRSKKKTEAQAPTSVAHQPVAPPHLHALYSAIDHIGLSMDELCMHTQMAIAELTPKLVEMELLGLIENDFGRYRRTA